MTFDADKELLKARASVHGFYFDGPTNDERRIKSLESILSLMFKEERKLKLERLMYKADARAWYHHKNGNCSREDRWDDLYRSCRSKLEGLKRCN